MIESEMTRQLSRSYLFVPANRPDRFAKAVKSGADTVVIDLEDAVPPVEKPVARAALAEWLTRGEASVIVQIGRAHV